MNTATQPTRRLFDANQETQLDYVHSYRTDLRAKWAPHFDRKPAADSLAPLLRASIAAVKAKKGTP